MWVEPAPELGVDYAHHAAARRAYELGRLRAAVPRALLVAALLGVLELVISGRHVLPLLPLPLLAWAFAYWRGHVFLRGALYGLVGGVVTALTPLWILRPCCDVNKMVGMTSGDCCTMPGACLAVGAVVGMVLAAVVPQGRASWWRTALGVALGMTSVAILKCATLFAGEAVGLVGGLVAGLAASTAARLWLGRRAAT